MRELKDNIWAQKEDGIWIIIPTNGSIQKDGTNYMLDNHTSAEVRLVYDDVPLKLAKLITKGGNVPYKLKDEQIITCPIKHKYDDKPDIELIKQSILKVIKIVDDLELTQVAMPCIGCDDKVHSLNWKKEVKHILKDILDDRFIIIIK